MLLIIACFGMVILLLKNAGKPGPENTELHYSISTEKQEPMVDKFPPKHNNILANKETTLLRNPKPVHPNRIKPIAKLDRYGNVDDLRETVRHLNGEQNILNLRRFPTRSKDSIVIVVQVHKRSNYLMKLIESLGKAKGISGALLIISHDYYSSEINSIVRRIDFCQVLQIFFPYSQQLHPDKFPGADPNDCPRDTPRSQARAMACINAEHPDMYGHYREVKYTMTKHHWWWKLNRVFNELQASKSHDGLVLLLEEDHYVAPDFYEVLKKAYKVKKTDTRCREYNCDIITLGDYKTVSSFQTAGSQIVRIQPWRSTENNMGMAFDRATWMKIAKCSQMFCTYDDYNWDWTLMRMSLRCLQKPLTVLLFRAPRVFHLGTCGLHHNNNNCNIESVLAQAEDVINRSKDALDPASLEVEIAHPWIQGHSGQANGGWGDIRDHELCLNFTKSTN